ncbi:alpha-E domain-containing protein [Dysosmobacter sp. HCP28S3_G4]|uniref:alpha-E domain-containing protein n=1 Tax=Dysosmobacter sp. HCP28S3_G4 TaxID=3438938 RepID=UPI003F886D5E
MGTVTLSKQNRLFWLGRYTERVYSTIQFMSKLYDQVIDGGEADYAGVCRRLGVPCPYTSAEDFCRRYLFDPQDPSSVISSVENMLGNGMVLRETISTPTLAYVQIAHSAMELAAKSDSPQVELQWVMDDIMAFQGSFDDSVEAESARNITKSGGSVERISMMLRLGTEDAPLRRELRKLLNRLYKTDLPVDQTALETVTQMAVYGADVPLPQLLASVEGLFCV